MGEAARSTADVAHDELIDFDGDEPEFDLHEGRAPPAPPGAQDLWVAESQGSGEQAVTWDAEFGRWTAVVMNADAARGIDVDADAGGQARLGDLGRPGNVRGRSVDDRRRRGRDLAHRPTCEPELDDGLME